MTRSRLPEANRLEVVQGKALGTEVVIVRAVAGMDAFGRAVEVMTQVAIVELGQSIADSGHRAWAADWYHLSRVIQNPKIIIVF